MKKPIANYSLGKYGYNLELRQDQRFSKDDEPLDEEENMSDIPDLYRQVLRSL